MKKHLIAAAALAVVAAPASAEIGGGRVEAVFGWDDVGVEIDDFDGDFDESGVVYGIGLGYDFAVSARVALGIDAEATLGSTDLAVIDGTDSAEIEVGRDLYLGGRVTTALSPTFNLHGKIGYTNARIKARVTSGTVTERDAANGDGIRLGLGGQYQVAANAYVGAEYRYSNYEGGFSRNQVVGTVGFRF